MALPASHDGRRVALDAHDQEVDIWMWDFARRTLTRVTFGRAEEHTSVWAPDGRRLIFVSARDKTLAPFSQASDGTGQAERIVGDTRTFGQPALSPDGRRLVLRGVSADTGQDLLLITMDGDRRVEPLLTTPFTERLPDISPDGRWIAYESNESGALEVYVRPFPNIDDGRWQISSGGGRQARWSRDGRELFFLSADTALMSAAIAARPDFSVAPAVELFDARGYDFAADEVSYDVAPDGRFLLLKNASIAMGARITLMSNWFEELKRLVPTN
jgi:serine/threonine-protein kinase